MSVLSLVLGKKTGRLPERRRPAFPMVALAVLFSVMALLPLGFVAAVGIETGWPTIKALVFRPRVAELLSNTLWLTLLAVPISIVLGVAVAWLTERTALAGRQLWSALAVLREDSQRPALAEDILSDGSLLVRYADGATEALFSGEVSILPQAE